jgi:hypothetical protein
MISILIPSYKRPFNVVEFTTSAYVTAKCPEQIEILFGVHEDDIQSLAAIQTLNDHMTISIRAIILKKYMDGLPHLSFFWNQLYEKSNYDIIGFFGDDVIMRTVAWDEMVINEFVRDKHILVYGDDVHCQKGNCATLFFTHKKTHREFGFYLPPYFRRTWMDQFLDNAYRAAGKIVYKKNLKTEHIHPGKFVQRTDDVFRNLEQIRSKDAGWGQGSEDLQKCVNILRKLGTTTEVDHVP